MLVIPYESIDLNKGEDIHAACERVRATAICGPQGRWAGADLRIDGKNRRPIAVYAPTKGEHRARFFTALRRKVSRTSVMGIDANCVPDIVMDLNRTATSPYDNRGANVKKLPRRPGRWRGPFLEPQARPGRAADRVRTGARAIK